MATSKELQQKVTAAKAALQQERDELAAAEVRLQEALTAEATGGESAKPAREAVAEQKHRVEVAEALVPVLEGQLAEAVRIEAAGNFKRLREEMEKACKELDEHPAAAVLADAFKQAEDFDTKSRAMRHLREAFVAAGGNASEYPTRRIKVKPLAMREFEATVTRDMAGITGSATVVISGKEKAGA